MISIAELKEHIRITGTDEDTYLAELEAAAVQFVETQTRRYFGPVREISEFRRPVGDSLYLSAAPVSSGDDYDESTVTVLRRSSATATAEAVAATEFAVRGQRLVNPTGWGHYEYQVFYTTGYAPGAEPEDIRGLVRDLVALAYRARGGFESEMGSYAVQFADVDSIPGVRDTIRAYRRKPFFGVA